MQTFSHFDKAYCVHYPDDIRRRDVALQFEKVGLSPKYIHADRPHIGFSITNMRRNPKLEVACSMSHIRAVVASIDDKRPIIFEDDVEFSSDWPVLLSTALADLPEDWDILYLGGHPRDETEKVGDCLYKIKTFSCAEAYAFNNGAQKRFLDFWANRFGQKNAMYDFILGEFAAASNGYAIYPTITSQVCGYSHIAKCVDKRKADVIHRGWQVNT